MPSWNVFFLKLDSPEEWAAHLRDITVCCVFFLGTVAEVRKHVEFKSQKEPFIILVHFVHKSV